MHICSQALSLGHGTSSSVFWVLMRNTILSRILMLLPNESREIKLSREDQGAFELNEVILAQHNDGVLW